MQNLLKFIINNLNLLLNIFIQYLFILYQNLNKDIIFFLLKYNKRKYK